MSRPAFRLTLQGTLLLGLLPVLAVLIITYATHVYYALNDLIMEGFDHKLMAVCSTTASFLDPADHAKLVDPLPLGGLSRDPSDNLIWGYDVNEGRFLKIRPTDGFAIVTPIKLPKGFNNIASGIEKNALLVLDGATGQMKLLSTITGETTDAFRLEPPITGLATDNPRGLLYASGRTLDRVDLHTLQVTHLRELPEQYRDISFDTKHQILWALSEHGDELLDLDPADGSVRHQVKLVTEKPADAPAAWQPQPVSLVVFVYDPASDRMIGTSTSLVSVNWQTGEVSTKGFLPGFGREQGPIYLRYAVPMRRITNRTNLTFLYTQLVRNRDQITYGIDGTVGDKHSPLLSQDVLPESEIAGVQRLLTEGTPHITAVRAWEKWGLLKSAFVPIFDQLGHPVAMAGTDVDITTIRYETRRALVITFTFGAALLVLAGMLSYAIARQLNRPLALIKAAALRAAAGDFYQHVAGRRPRELHDLAHAFSHATATLGQSFHELRDAVTAGRALRDRDALVQRLSTVGALAATAPAGSPWAWGVLAPGREPAGSSSGATMHDGAALVWLHCPMDDAVGTAARRAEIALTAEALLRRHGPDATRLAAPLGRLFAGEIDLWGLLTPAGVHVLARRPGLVHRVTADGAPAVGAAPDFLTPLPAASGELIVLAHAGSPVERLTVPATGAGGAAAAFAAWRGAVRRCCSRREAT